MEQDDPEALVFQYTEDEDGVSCLANMTDEQIVELLSQFIQRDTGETMH